MVNILQLKTNYASDDLAWSLVLVSDTFTFLVFESAILWFNNNKLILARTKVLKCLYDHTHNRVSRIHNRYMTIDPQGKVQVTFYNNHHSPVTLHIALAVSAHPIIYYYKAKGYCCSNY